MFKHSIFKIFLLATGLLMSTGAWADAGFFDLGAAGIKLYHTGVNDNEYIFNASGSANQQLGLINNLYLKGWWFKVWDDNRNVVQDYGKLYYHVYKKGSTAPAFTESGKTTVAWWYDDSKNACIEAAGLNTNLLEGITETGEYILEFYYTGSFSNEIRYLSNGGADNNYKIEFIYQGSDLTATETTWESSDVNVALGKATYISSLWNGDKTKITDGKMGAEFQLKAANSTISNEWVVVDLVEEHNITKISITTQGDRQDAIYAICYASSQTPTPSFADGTDALDGQWEYVTFVNLAQETSQHTKTYSVDLQNVRYIKYKGISRYHNDQYGTQVNEIRVVGTYGGARHLETIFLSGAEKATVGQGTALTIVGKDQLSNDFDLSSTEISYRVDPVAAGVVEDGVYTPALNGWATITADAGNGITSSISILSWDGNIANIARGKSIIESPIADDATNAKLLNGQTGTAEEWNAGGSAGEFDLVIDLQDYYDIHYLDFVVARICPSTYTVSVSNDNDSWTEIGNASYPNWNNDLPGSHHDYFVAPANSNVRYVKLHSVGANANPYGQAFAELQVYGELSTSVINISAAEYTTHIWAHAVAIPDGVGAYYVAPETAGDYTTLQFNKLNETIPANTGVMLYKENGGQGLNFEPADEIAAVANNLLHGNALEQYILTAEYTPYLLSIVDDVVAFYMIPFDENTNKVAAGKAVLEIPVVAGQQAPAAFRISLAENVATAVENVTITNDAHAPIYTITGVQVRDMSQPGIYIQNGQKFVIR